MTVTSCAAVLTDSASAADDCVQLLGVDRGRVTVIGVLFGLGVIVFALSGALVDSPNVALFIGVTANLCLNTVTAIATNQSDRAASPTGSRRSAATTVLCR